MNVCVRIAYAVLMLGGLFSTYCRATLAQDSQPMRVSIDARDLPRKLLHATVSIPITAEDQARQIALWYPKWVPGSHGPGGPVANVAGLKIDDSVGEQLSWRRSPGEVYRVLVDVPAGVQQLDLHLRYIANQPTTNSMGHDVFGSSRVGVISPGAVLFYEEGVNIDETEIEAELRLPAGWKASTALRPRGGEEDGSIYKYEPSSLRAFVDSPIMCGMYRKIYSLNDDAAAAGTPPHRLHVFSDDESSVELNPEVVSKLKEMVTQASLLMGSHPFDQFEMLLAVTDRLPANGLEHLRSSLNVLPRGAVSSLARLKGWNRLLIPHEYMHAWCGKYRRPAGMLTPDFHTAKATELLWVYEGLTQYLGELVEARCGLMNAEEFRHRLGVELRIAAHQQNRNWRSLADTAAASHILRGRSESWPSLRGSQDYYMEGMLLWLEIDAILRIQSNGKVSLDDFCQRFFKGSQSNHPKAFDRGEIIDTLNALVEHDWNGLIQRRVESPRDQFDSDLPQLLGYRLELSSAAPSIPSSTFRYRSSLDEYDSLGCTFSNDGSITDVILGSPADLAKLSPGTRVVGVNGQTWSANALREAVRKSGDGQQIELLVENDDALRTVQLHYDGGARYLALVRDEEQADLLENILKPRTK